MMHVIETELPAEIYKQVLQSNRENGAILRGSERSLIGECSRLSRDARTFKEKLGELASEFPPDFEVTVANKKVKLFPPIPGLDYSTICFVGVTDDRVIPCDDNAVIEHWEGQLYSLLTLYGFTADVDVEDPREQLLTRTRGQMETSLRMIVENTFLNTVFGYDRENPDIALYLSDPEEETLWFTRMDLFSCERTDPVLTDVPKAPKRIRPYIEEFQKIYEKDGVQVIVAANLSDIVTVNLLEMGASLELQNSYDTLPRDIPPRVKGRPERKRQMIIEWQMALLSEEDEWLEDFHGVIPEPEEVPDRPALYVVSD